MIHTDFNKLRDILLLIVHLGKSFTFKIVLAVRESVKVKIAYLRSLHFICIQKIPFF